jgi:hypothetical protein
VITGRLTAHVSHQITHRGDTAERPGDYEREYELRLALPGDRDMLVPFRIPGRDDRIRVQPGDVVSAIALLRDGKPADVVQVIDHTTDVQYAISDPVARAVKVAATAAIATGMTVALILAALRTRPATLILAVVASAIVYWLVRRPAVPTLPGTSAGAPLETSQALLEEKLALVRDRQRLDEEVGSRRAQRDRLVALRTKMEDVGRDLYGTRIDTIGRAIGLVEQQLEVDRQIIETLERMIKIVEIEIEAGATVGALPDDAAAVLDGRKVELEALRERHADLTRQLEANEEVERTLNPTAPE